MKNLLITILLLIGGCAWAQVTHVIESDSIDGDYYYVLPKTALVFSGSVVKTSYVESKNFENDLFVGKTIPGTQDTVELLKKLGVDKALFDSMCRSVGSSTIVKYKLTDLKLVIEARPDANKIFKVSAKKKFLKNRAFNFTYGENGLLLSGDLSSESKVFEAIVKGVGAVATIITGAKGSEEYLSNTHTEPKPWVKELLNAMEQYEDKILDDIHNNFDVYKDVKAILSERISNLFSDFFYTTKVTTTPFTIAYIPDPKNNNIVSSVVVFDFDTKDGVLSVNNSILSNLEIVTAYDVNDTKKLEKGHSLYITPSTRNFSNFFVKRKLDEKGFAYNVPASAEVLHKDPAGNNKEFKVVKVAQFGKVAYINYKQTKVGFELDPLTGELKKISGEAKSLSGDDIAAAGSSADALLKAIKGDSETAKLEAEFKKLELKKKIQDLKDTGIQ